MIKRIAGKMVRLGSLRRATERQGIKSTLNSAAAVFSLLLLLVAPLLPRAFGQSRSHAGNQNLPRNLPGPNESQLLRYDARRNMTGSPGAPGFYNASGVCAHSASGSGGSAIGRSTGSEYRPSQPSGLCPPAITQSTSQEIATGAVACTDPGIGTL